MDVGPFLHLVLSRAALVDPEPLPQPLCRDPHDDKFVAGAAAARAPCLVSGDQDLLALSQVMGVIILSPWTFVDTVLRRNC